MKAFDVYPKIKIGTLILAANGHTPFNSILQNWELGSNEIKKAACLNVLTY
jgi:hypothetical protein